MFDVNNFMAATYNEPTSTESINPPEGEFPAVITSVSPRQVTVDGENRIVMDVLWDLQDTTGSIEAVTGRKKNTAKQGIFLDTTPEGHIDMGAGKNPTLGRVREAIGQNTPGVAWAPGKMVGCPARVTVRHKGDGERTYANVISVAKL